MTRNKRFPRYEDDADYTTNAPSYYHDLGRKNKLLEKLAHKIWEYDERLDERLEDLEKVLQDYLSQWDERIENLDDEVSHIFVTWLEDGTLEQIINHDVLGNKADKTFVDSEIERLEQKDDNIIDQLIQKAQQNMLDVSKPPYNVTDSDVHIGINQAINDGSLTGQSVYIPFKETPYELDADKPIVFKSNLNLVIDDGVVFKVKPTDLERYRAFYLNDVENVHVKGNFKLIGERDEHIGNTGEWGMGVEFRGVKNVYFEHVNVKNFWGDGVYIGVSTEKNYCENIVIDHLHADHNRRQGMSVISVKGLTINGGLIENTVGTLPEAAIDFEPNDNTQFLEDININIKTKNNAGAGVLFYFGTYSNTKNVVDITFNNFISDGDELGVSFAGGGNINGNIDFLQQSTIRNSNHYGIRQRRWSSTSPLITFEKPVIINPLETQTTVNPMYASGILVSNYDTDDLSDVVGDYLGNIILKSPSVIETRLDKRIQTAIYVNNYKNPRMVEKVQIINPIRLDAIATKMNFNAQKSLITDRFKVLEKSLVNEFNSLRISNYAYSFTNKDITEPTVLDIGSSGTSVASGTEVYIYLEKSVRVTIQSTLRIYPLEDTPTQSIYSQMKGSSILLKRGVDDSWEVVSVVGEWIAE